MAVDTDSDKDHDAPAVMLDADEGGGAPVEEGAPLWMTTFGDLMSLLLTFFVLLFSMSELKMEKFVAASESFREALGGASVIPLPVMQGLSQDPAHEPVPADSTDPSVPVGELAAVGEQSVAELMANAYLEAVYEKVLRFIEEHDLQETLLVTNDPAGVRVRVKASALFSTGSGTLEEGSEWIVAFIADLSDEIEMPVVVSGHADDQPIHTAQFPSNWELSAFRAAGVARALGGLGYDPALVRVESYGSMKPIASNDTPMGRAQNRRVEFFFDRRDVIASIEKWRDLTVESEMSP